MNNAVINNVNHDSATPRELWLCLRFSSLSLNCLGVLQNSDTAVAVSYQQQIWQLNELAYQAGVRCEQSVSHALMLLPSLQLFERDLYKESQTLERLSNWAYRFTPHVHVYDDHTLLLEIGRSLSLFKGLKHIQHLISHDLRNANVDCDFGLATTPKSSHLLSFLEIEEWPKHNIEQNIKQRLADADLRYLAIESKLIEKLQHCGFKCLADIQGIPRPELGERFGQKFITYLDLLYGNVADPQLFKVPDEVFRSRIDFAEPISNRTWIEQQLERLLSDLVEFLRSRNLVCRMFSWCFYNEKNHLLHTVNVSLATLQTDLAMFKELTDLQFENTVMQWEFASIELSSHSLQQKNAVDADLFNPKAEQEGVNQLLDKLINRLGEQALFKVFAVPEYLPELACQKISIRQSPAQNAMDMEGALLDEPLW